MLILQAKYYLYQTLSLTIQRGNAQSGELEAIFKNIFINKSTSKLSTSNLEKLKYNRETNWLLTVNSKLE